MQAQATTLTMVASKPDNCGRICSARREELQITPIADHLG